MSGQIPGRVIPGAFNLYLIDEKDMNLLAMNGCSRIVLTSEHLPNGLADEVMSGPDFNIPLLAMNYIYKPTDPAILSKYPHLQYLPT